MSSRALRVTAWVSAAVHAAGLGAALLLMREGTPLVPLAERLRYLAEHATRWRLGWAIWIACALALVAFAAALARRLRRPLARAALAAMLLAATIDLVCDAIYCTWFVDLARQGPPEAFLALERAIGIASVAGGNGLYTLGVLLFALALRGEPAPGRLARVAAVACVVAGTAMAVAGLAGSAEGLAAATGPTIGAFAVWSLAVAHGLERG